MTDAGYNNKKRKEWEVWEEDQVQHQEEEKQGRERSFRQGTEVEYRNVRGIYSSIKEIEAAAAKGYTPALYILSETWMEHAEQPKIKDYIPIAYVKARRRKRQGRASGGISVYKHKDCTTPIRQLPQVCTEHDHGRRCKTCPPPTDVITLEIGGSEVKAERTTVTAYYCPPNQGPGGEARYFGKLTKYMEWLSLHNHRSILVGDSNGDRNLQGQPRFNKSRNNRAAEALVQLERKTGHTWMRPSNKGPCFTRYAISRERMDNEPDYDPADATSAVDHLSICPQVRREGQLMSYRLHEELHMGADHVGLQFVIRAATCIELPLSKKPRESKRKSL